MGHCVLRLGEGPGFHRCESSPHSCSHLKPLVIFPCIFSLYIKSDPPPDHSKSLAGRGGIIAIGAGEQPILRLGGPVPGEMCDDPAIWVLVIMDIMGKVFVCGWSGACTSHSFGPDFSILLYFAFGWCCGMY